MNASVESLRQKGQFEMDVQYDPNVYYSALTRDHRPLRVVFENNWDSAVATSYDPFNNIYAYVETSLLANYVPEADRSQKVYRFRGDIERIHHSWDRNHDYYESVFHFTYEKREEGTKLFQSALGNQGIDADYTRKARRLVFNKPYKGRIDLENVISLVYPEGEQGVPGILIASPEEFSEHFKNFFDLLKKTIVAIYETEHKDLPPTKLIFAYSGSESKNEGLGVGFKMNCSYCHTSYQITPKSTTMSCPSCGAPPVFPHKE